jgi:hypothetical protein
MKTAKLFRAKPLRLKQYPNEALFNSFAPNRFALFFVFMASFINKSTGDKPWRN